MASTTTSTVQTIISRFKRGKPEAETAYLLQIFNDVAKTLTDRVEDAGAHLAYTVSLIAQQREYVIPGWIRQAQAIYYYNSGSPGDGYALWAVDTDKLEDFQVGWRTYTLIGPPQYGYITTQQADTSTEPATPSPTAPGSCNVFGMDAVPQTTSAGSPPYPCVIIYCSVCSTFGLNDYLPDNLSSDDTWVNMMEALYAASMRPEEYAMRHQISELAIQQVNAVQNERLRQDHFSITQGWFQRRRRQ